MTLLYILLAVLIEYSPKESSLEPPGILWFGHSASYPISMWILSPPSDDGRPTTHTKAPYLLIRWLVGWVRVRAAWVVGRIYLLIRWTMLGRFFFNFMDCNVSGIERRRIYNWFEDFWGIILAFISYIFQKIGTVAKNGTHEFINFGFKKVVFLTFSKLVWSCSELFKALFSALKGPILVLFSAWKFDIWPLKSKI